MSNLPRKRVNSQGLAITAGVVGGMIVAGTVSNVPEAKAENPRVSVAVTNILSNTNAANFAAEVVAPPTDFLFTSASVQVNYVINSFGGDSSNILVESGTVTAVPTAYVGAAFTNTVESAIAASIDAALAANRYGDIIGIVNAYNPPDKSNTEYARISAAITNILSNTNSQNFAAEIGGEPFSSFSQASAGATYQNASDYSVGSAFSDPSQVVISTGVFTANPTTYTGTLITNTVERAIAVAIDTAKGANRYGDVIGITNVYKGPGTQPVKNARASAAITNILSNTNALNTAGEVVAPEGYQISSITMNQGISDAADAVTNFLDGSQLLVNSATVEVVTATSGVAYFSDSVEKAIARAITSANDASRFGDVIGIVNAYKGPWGTGYANPRVSLAATNILSNLNSQNFAGEIVAPKDDFYFSGATIEITYVSSPSAIDQIVVGSGTISGTSVATEALVFSNTVEKATALAITDAETDGRLGDVIGIVRAWNPQSLD